MTSNRASRGILVFLASQLVLLSAVIACGAYRSRELASGRKLPPLRDRPLIVKPLYDYDVVVTDEQLRRVLSKIRLRFNGKETRIGHADHALRFWGPKIKFSDPAVMSGQDLLRLLTDHRRFAEVYGEDRDPLLIDVGPGVRVRALEGNTSSSHVDHTMACLAEIGTPLDYPIVTPERQTTYRAIVEQSLRDFSLNQFEYEWSTLTFAVLLPPTNRWMTAEGQVVTFDRLADRIMREELPRGVCSANHRLHALVMFLRVDDLMAERGQPRILSTDSRARIVRFLQDATARFVQHQHVDGFWNSHWPDSTPTSSQPTEADGDQLNDRIIATGHVMEWWALAPPEIHPPRHVLASAGQWLVRTVDQLTPEQTQSYSSFLSHAGRALALWRGKWPAQVDLREELRVES